MLWISIMLCMIPIERGTKAALWIDPPIFEICDNVTVTNSRHINNLFVASLHIGPQEMHDAVTCRCEVWCSHSIGDSRNISSWTAPITLQRYNRIKFNKRYPTFLKRFNTMKIQITLILPFLLLSHRLSVLADAIDECELKVAGSNLKANCHGVCSALDLNLCYGRDKKDRLVGQSR